MIQFRVTPENWLSCYINGEMEIFLALIDTTEKIISEGIEKFHNEKTFTIDEESNSFTYHYNGLSDHAWYLDSIFLEYYPTLHRASVLTIMCGAFERYIIELLKLIGEDPHNPTFRNAYTRIMEITNNSPDIPTSINRIILVRHAFSHCAGHIELHKEVNNEELSEHIATCEYLDNEGTTINMRSGYLQYAHNEYKILFQNISEAIATVEFNYP